MPIVDLYEHSEKRRELAHFATLASLAAVDGVISDEEKKVLDQFAFAMNITDDEYKEILKKENKYPIETPHSGEKRLKRLYDFLRIVFSDSIEDKDQMRMVEKYAIGLGFPVAQAEGLVKRSFDIFGGRISFEDYRMLLGK